MVEACRQSDRVKSYLEARSIPTTRLIRHHYLQLHKMTTSPADLIFITGSTGFIGSQVTVLALEAGYRVRLSVRKEQQIQKLKQLFHQFVSNIDFVVVPDITSSGAFDSVLDGVRYVFHLASPMPGKGADFRSEYAEPAVRGTETMLSSADRANSVEKVVIMSSVLALMPLGALGAKEGIFNGMA